MTVAWKLFDDGSGQAGYGSGGDRRYVSTFAGFVPADDPHLSLVVVVDEPSTRYTASAVAAPVFAEVGEYALRILGIAPDEPVAPAGARVRAAPAPQPDGDGSGEAAIGGAEPGR